MLRLATRRGQILTEPEHGLVATGSQKDDGDVDGFHDVSEGTGPTSHPTLNQ
jgi:hypothetical protein